MSTYKPISPRTHIGIANLWRIATDEHTVTCPHVRYVSDKIDRPPHVLNNACIILLFSVLLLNPDDWASVVSQVITFIPGVYGTYHHLSDAETSIMSFSGAGKESKTTKQAEGKRWLDYWFIYSTATFAESILGTSTIDAIFPLWWTVKVIGMAYVLCSGQIPSPNTKGSRNKPLPLKLGAGPRLQIGRVDHRPRQSTTPPLAKRIVEKIPSVPSTMLRRTGPGRTERPSPRVVRPEDNLDLMFGYSHSSAESKSDRGLEKEIEGENVQAKESDIPTSAPRDITVDLDELTTGSGSPSESSSSTSQDDTADEESDENMFEYSATSTPSPGVISSHQPASADSGGKPGDRSRIVLDAPVLIGKELSSRGETNR